MRPFCSFCSLRPQCLLDVDPSAAKVINGDGDTALHLAVDQECGQDLLSRLIRAYPEAVMAQNDLGLLPLHCACYLRAKETVDLLLSINPDSATVAGATGHLPAHYAAEFSTSAVLQSLAAAYEAGMLHPCADDNMNTPLLKAVASGNEDTVRFLCERFPGAVSASNALGLNAMHFAAEGDSLTILRMLHAVCPDNLRRPDHEGRLPLMVFCEVHQDIIHENDREADCLRFLLDRHPESVTLQTLGLCTGENSYLRRLMLRAQPHIQPDELAGYNYANRRLAMFLAFAAINADGIPCIFSRLRATDLDVLRTVVSYL